MGDITSGNGLDHRVLLESLNDGVYATDLSRRIIYWSPAAERITGWRAEDIVGKRCADNVLSHINKDGCSLCHTETCPLHRSIVTGHSSKLPIIVFAQCSDGSRIPTRVSVAPIRNAAGEVVGGVETFHEVSDELRDARLARRIQTAMLNKDIPRDERVSFAVRYLPLDMIGGDYYAITRVDADRIAFILADVAGHGLAAALYTVYLDALWCNNTDLLGDPGTLTEVMTKKLSAIIGNEPRFATALLGLIDLSKMQLTLTSAGGPAPLLFRNNGEVQQLDGSGLPLGCFMVAEKYEQKTFAIAPGDCLLAFTDGALEIHDTNGKMLGREGLENVLGKAGYPASQNFDAIAEMLLKSSDRIRLADDLTFMEIRFAGK